jgi:hypothetical protein
MDSMKLPDTRENYQFLTGKLGDISRQLSLAALGIIWIFKTDQPSHRVSVPHYLLWPGILAIASLTFDILQYVYSSIAYGILNRRMEKKLDLDESKEFSFRREINWPTIAFLWMKVAAVLACYALLLRYLCWAIRA